MDSLDYSNEALATKGLFYNKTYTVYVEGKDDRHFWKYLFELADKNVHIEDVGGINEIEKYIKKIIDEDSDFIVACDSDYSDFYQNKIAHPNVINTYGYSIENSLYNPLELEKVIHKLSRTNVSVIEIINNWIEEFSQKIEELLVYDIANARFDKGIAVLPNNCTQFLNSKLSHKISLQKVNSHIDKIKNRFTKDEITEVKKLIQKSPKNLWFHLRGHFLTIGVTNLIKTLVKDLDGTAPTFSNDVLYAFTIDCRENWQEKIDILTVVDHIKKICA
jgi:hypothetical protein